MNPHDLIPDYLNKTELMIYSDPVISYMIPTEKNGYRGVECEDGWADHIIQSLHEIATLDEYKTFRIALIKEKFGKMRMHIDGIPDTHMEQIYTIIYKAESNAGHICERCGSKENVTTGGDGWIRSLCQTCRDE